MALLVLFMYQTGLFIRDIISGFDLHRNYSPPNNITGKAQALHTLKPQHCLVIISDLITYPNQSPSRRLHVSKPRLGPGV